MSWSALLDRGREEMIVWPAIERVNSRGTTDVYPDSDNPIRMWVTTSEDRSRIADLPGQVEIEITRVVTRSFPRGVEQTWSKVMLNDKEYDLSEPIRESFGPSRAMNHFEFKLRSRANIGRTELDEGYAVPVITRRSR